MREAKNEKYPYKRPGKFQTKKCPLLSVSAINLPRLLEEPRSSYPEMLNREATPWRP